MLLQEKKLQEQFKQKKISPIYWFVGSDNFKVDFYLSTLRKFFRKSNGDFSEEIYFGNEIKVNELIDSYNSVSLFASSKLILVRAAEQINEKNLQSIVKSINSPHRNNLLIFLATKIDKRKKSTKELFKIADLSVIEIKKASSAELDFWYKILLKRFNIEKDVLEKLSIGLGYDLPFINQTLEKATLFTKSDKITLKALKSVSSFHKTESVFLLSDYLLSGDLKSALSILNRLWIQQEEPIPILALLTLQIRLILKIQSLRNENYSYERIRAKLHLQPRRAQKLWELSTKLDDQVIHQTIQEICKTDFNMKFSSKNPRSLVESFIYDFSEIIRKSA